MDLLTVWIHSAHKGSFDAQNLMKILWSEYLTSVYVVFSVSARFIWSFYAEMIKELWATSFCLVFLSGFSVVSTFYTEMIKELGAISFYVVFIIRFV